MLKSATSFLAHLRRDNPARWRPILAVYYLTYRCRFRCTYCSDGAGRPYYRLQAPELSGREVLALLAQVRRHVEHLVLTGGEPLDHPDLPEILAGLPALRFASVTLTTNGYELDRLLPLPRGSVTDLVVSLDTLDAAKADACYGMGSGTHARILANLERATHRPPRHYRIILSCVLTPENLDDVDALFDFASARGYRFAACPVLRGVHPDSALRTDLRYQRFYNRMIREKLRGVDVFGPLAYLRAMRDLPRFHCRPFTMLTVDPAGEVFYPCLEIGHRVGNLQIDTDLDALRLRGAERHGPPPRCGTQCHSACALGFASLLDHPEGLLQEGILAFVRPVRRWLAGR